MGREMTLDALIKQINMNGGKTAPLYAQSLSEIARRVSAIESKEGATRKYLFDDEMQNKYDGILNGVTNRMIDLDARYNVLAFSYTSSVICMIIYLIFGG